MCRVMRERTIRLELLVACVLSGVLLAGATSPAWAVRGAGLGVSAPQVLLAAQADQDEPPCKPVLCLTPTKFDVGWQSGSVRFFVTNCECETMDWSAVSACGWATVEPTGGTLGPLETVAVVVTYTYNDSCDGRTCDIAVAAPGAIGSPTAVKLNQGQRTTPDMCVAPTVRNVWQNSGVVGFEIWNWSCVTVNWSANADCEWVTSINPPGGTLQRDERVLVECSVQANPDCDIRSCRVYFTSPGQTDPKYGLINQAGSTRSAMEVDQTRIDVGAAFGLASFQISNTSCGDMEWEAEASCSWVAAVSPASGIVGPGESQTVNLVYEANEKCAERQCLVEVTSNAVQGTPAVVTLVQEPGGPPLLSVSPTSLKVGNSNGWTAFTVKNSGCSSMSWTATHGCGWLTSVAPNTGVLNAQESITVAVVYGANTLPEERNCSITVDAPGAGGPKTVAVTQTGLGSPQLVVTPLAQSVGAGAGTFTFAVANAGQGTMSWSAQQDCSWITRLSPPMGTLTAGQSSAVTVNYGTNPAATPRTCSIAVTAPGTAGSPQTVAVQQDGLTGTPVLSLAPASRTVLDEAGTTTFTVSNSGSAPLDWTTGVSCGWVQASPSGGTLTPGQGAVVSVSYEANSDPSTRSCAVLVTAPGASGSPKTFSLGQAGNDTPVLELSGVSQALGSKAGIATFTVKNAGGGTMNWSAAAGCSWVTRLAPASGSLVSGQSINVVVSYDGNSGGAARNCAITVQAPGAAGSPQTLTLNQAGDETPALSVSPTTIEAEATDALASFTVTNTGQGTLNWSAAWECDWVAGVAPENGALAAGASETVTASFSENDGADARTCEVAVIAEGAAGSPKTVTLEQAGTEEPPPCCCGPAGSLLDKDWKSTIQRQLGDLLLLGASLVVVLAFARFRKD